MVGSCFTLIQERNSSAAEIQGAMEVRCGRRAGGLTCHSWLGHVEEFCDFVLTGYEEPRSLAGLRDDCIENVVALEAFLQVE